MLLEAMEPLATATAYLKFTTKTSAVEELERIGKELFGKRRGLWL